MTELGKATKTFHLTLRTWPTVLWTTTVFAIMVAWAYKLGALSPVNALLAFLGGVSVQMVSSHTVNDYWDWKSGVDKKAGFIASSGKKVFKSILNPETEAWKIFLPFFAILPFQIALAAYFGYIYGWWFPVLAIGGGLYVAVGYTAPPIRASYRPFHGEWLHAYPGMILASALFYFAATGLWLSIPTLMVAATYSFGLIALLEEHHLSDIKANLMGEPKKYTVPAWLFERKGVEAVGKYLKSVMLAWILVIISSALFADLKLLIFLPQPVGWLVYYFMKHKAIKLLYEDRIDELDQWHIAQMRTHLTAGFVYALLVTVL